METQEKLKVKRARYPGRDAIVGKYGGLESRKAVVVLCAEYGVSDSTARDWLRRAGIYTPDAGKNYCILS